MLVIDALDDQAAPPHPGLRHTSWLRQHAAEVCGTANISCETSSGQHSSRE